MPLVLSVVCALAGFGLGQKVTVRSEPFTPLTASPVAAARPLGFITGMNVNVRSGPGLFYSPVQRLSVGDEVALGQEQDGWWAVTTSHGTTGWVYGAFLRGAVSADRGAAIVTQLLTASVGGAPVELRPGDKVFALWNGGEQALILLPDGRRLLVTPEALNRVE